MGVCPIAAETSLQMPLEWIINEGFVLFYRR